MGLCISMPSSNSKVNPSSETPDISMSLTLIAPPNSIQTSRELSPAPTSSPTSTRTVTPSTGESFRSMDDLQEGDNRQQMTLTQQHLTQAVSQRLLESLRKNSLKILYCNFII
uniref:Regulatory protein n=1 Tax=Croton yellow vein mosaic virus TaxID=207697 RepID=H2E7U9_9GEMI|nr:regulatory protein [Croton yellow vein mosaic virus]